MREGLWRGAPAGNRKERETSDMMFSTRIFFRTLALAALMSVGGLRQMSAANQLLFFFVVFHRRLTDRADQNTQ